MNEIENLKRLAGILKESVQAVPAIGKIDEKSKSEKQARFMAAAAHDPDFAKRVGISQDVAKEFNKADTGTKQLSNAMKKDESIDNREITDQEVQDAYRKRHEAFATDAPNKYALDNYASMLANRFAQQQSIKHHGTGFDPITGALLRHGVDEAHVDTCRQTNKNSARDACAMESIAEGAGPTVHTFDDSGQAYDATQTGEWFIDDESQGYPTVEVKNGDILVIPDEGVVGLCSTWPVAITKNPGKLHQMKDEYSTPEDIAEVTNLPLENVQAAFQKAQELGFETVGNIKEDLNNGYRDIEVASGQDFFPNGADSPVVKKVGPSGARHGDNPEQKSMKVSEEHKELVYAYRKFLQESTNSKTLKKKLNESQQVVSDIQIQDHNLDITSDTDSISASGPISVSASSLGRDGQPKEIGFNVWIEANSEVEWESDESPTGWNYSTDSATYTSYEYAIATPVQFQSIEFDANGTFLINGNEVSFQDFQQYLDPSALQSLLDPKIYTETVDKIFSDQAEKIEPPEPDYNEPEDYDYDYDRY